MSRSSGHSEARFPVFKSLRKLGTHLSTHCRRDERLSQPYPARRLLQQSSTYKIIRQVGNPNFACKYVFHMYTTIGDNTLQTCDKSINGRVQNILLLTVNIFVWDMERQRLSGSRQRSAPS
ncbi:hypothetical protein TNCV_4113031 [Trichonephila clavipes]|nr:hypothetical protein TNCV_4113031 [Trichonephila clavipes]